MSERREQPGEQEGKVLEFPVQKQEIVLSESERSELLGHIARLELMISGLEEDASILFEALSSPMSEGKTKRQARKCLARQLVRLVFNILKD